MLLATWGRLDEEDWRRLVAELRVAQGDTVEGWQSAAAADLRFARRVTSTERSAGEAIVSRGDCTVVVDGWIGDVDDRGSVAAVRALEAYLRWGPRFASKLKGEFAFVLHDAKAREVLVGCDVVGTRAPAWLATDSSLVVCSRAVGVLRHPAAVRQWNHRYFAHMVSGILSTPAELTAFEGVRRLVPGSTLRFELSRKPLLAREVFREQLQPVTLPPASRDVEERLLSLLDEATARRIGGARIGLALSGGLDSAVVATTLVARARTVDAYAMVDRIGPNDANPALMAVARHLRGLSLHLVQAAGALGLGAESDGPVADDPVVAGPAMQSARLLLFRTVASAGVERLFNGDGADELFDIAWRSPRVVRGMSPLDAFEYLARRGPRRHLVARAVEASNLPRPWRRAVLLPRIRQVAASVPWLTTGFGRSEPFAMACDDLFDAASSDSGAERTTLVLAAMQRNHFAQSLAHAAVGLEQASPFLDRDVAGAVAALPSTLAARPGGLGKPLLRAAAAHRLPAANVESQKAELLDAALCARALRRDVVVGDALTDVMACAPLRDMIDVNALGVALRDVGALSPNARQRAFRLLFVARWARRFSTDQAF